MKLITNEDDDRFIDPYLRVILGMGFTSICIRENEDTMYLYNDEGLVKKINMFDWWVLCLLLTTKTDILPCCITYEWVCDVDGSKRKIVDFVNNS